MNNKKSNFVILYSLCESTERLKEGDQIVKVEEGMIDTFPLKEDDWSIDKRQRCYLILQKAQCSSFVYWLPPLSAPEWEETKVTSRHIKCSHFKRNIEQLKSNNSVRKIQ